MSKSLSTGQMTILLLSTPLTPDLSTVARQSLLKKRAIQMAPTVVSVVTITWTRELMSSPLRDVSSPLTDLLLNLTDPNQASADHFQLRHWTRSVFESELRDSKSIMKHSIIYQDEKICFSQDPVIKCSANTVPKELRKKTVNFVCLSEGRIAKMYIEKVERGERIPELKRQEVDFQVEMDQPISCHSPKF